MVSFISEPIFHLGSFTVTNAVLDTLLVDALLLGGAFFIAKKLTYVPNLFQNIVESIIETFYDMTSSIAPTNALKIFPFFMSFFLFILLANWSGLIPGVGTIGFFENHKLVPLLRSTTSDFNTTLALALISAVSTHILSIKLTGVKDYLSRFFSINPMNFFIGIL